MDNKMILCKCENLTSTSKHRTYIKIEAEGGRRGKLKEEEKEVKEK